MYVDNIIISVANFLPFPEYFKIKSVCKQWKKILDVENLHFTTLGDGMVPPPKM